MKFINSRDVNGFKIVNTILVFNSKRYNSFAFNVQPLLKEGKVSLHCDCGYDLQYWQRACLLKDPSPVPRSAAVDAVEEAQQLLTERHHALYVVASHMGRGTHCERFGVLNVLVL